MCSRKKNKQNGCGGFRLSGRRYYLKARKAKAPALNSWTFCFRFGHYMDTENKYLLFFMRLKCIKRSLTAPFYINGAVLIRPVNRLQAG
ncbi:hypothetical protein D6O09_24545 [Salmonella enterica]|nr:hypothetical protein [Salmonella enterica]EAU2299083.1 hypothetical protein [Salmonella enterica]